MTTTTINNADAARKVADKIVTLLTSISEQESAREREKNTVDAKYAAILNTLKEEVKELQAAFLKWLKKTANQEALFDEGNRSGHSTLATFGYRDTPPALKALQGKLDDVAAQLFRKGKTGYLTVEQPKVSINLGKLKAANLGASALTDLGMR